MAQTRAGSKALRNALAWVVVLAGYKPTPAEEMAEHAGPGEVLDAVPFHYEPPVAQPPTQPDLQPVKEATEDRPFLLNAVNRGLKGFAGDERGELFTAHLDGKTPDAATTAELNALYLFLSDTGKVSAWRKSRSARA
jgi:hypothetical protein